MRGTMAAVLWLLAGCGGGTEYSIDVELPAGADTSDAVRMEVNVVRDGCDRVPENGGVIVEAEIVRPLGWHTGDAPTDVGDLVPGFYGFAARFLRDDCTAVYSGCDAQEIEEDGEGAITIVLHEADGQACLPTAICMGADGCVVPE